MAQRVVPPYIPTHVKPKILFVSSAPMGEELIFERWIAGPAGREFDRMLKLAEVNRGDCAITGLFNQQVPNDEIENLLLDAKDFRETMKPGQPNEGYPYSPIKRGKFLHPDWTWHVGRLWEEIFRVDPNLIVTLGDEALWAVTGEFGITAKRGAVTTTASCPWGFGRTGALGAEAEDYKVLPTYHPAYIMRQYKHRIPMIADLMKAAREAEYPEIRHTARELWLEPTLDDIREFKRAHLDAADVISVDIETSRGQITAIAFAPRRDLALCIPFTDWTVAYSHWSSLNEELAAWRLVKEICESPTPKLLQNGSYDAQWLWEKRRIKLINYSEDTRMLHHALYPELPKSLQFLGSVYENEGAWKMMRSRKTEKRDE